MACSMESSNTHELQDPLLAPEAKDPSSHTGNLLHGERNIRRGASFMLKGFIWVLLMAWISMFLLYPTAFFANHIRHPLFEFTRTSYLLGGYSLLLFTLPILIVAILAALYLEVSEKDKERERRLDRPRISLWTCPALVDGLLGVVSYSELLFLAFTLLYTAWFLWSMLRWDFIRFHYFSQWQFKLALVGLRLGILGLIFLGFLFLLVCRGSILLRLIGIPFEHAVKYHIWLGHFMMAIFTAHGLIYVFVWYHEGRLVSELLRWQKTGVANLPGVIALVAGWSMWVTSMHPVRHHCFELFFYMHQLYAVFIVFLALHIGDLILGIAVGGIFLFLLDRLLRFCQSRRAVTILSTRVLPCDTIELVLSKPSSLQYNALSFVFLNVPGLSWLQWHPFSVSSSPYDDQNSIAVLIKPLGSWTRKLKDSIAAATEVSKKGAACPFQMYIRAEGPYGHESNYFLRYKTLILVAGGIGISPFIAILRDLLHRHKLHEINLPENILLIWAVKTSKELIILDLVNPTFICADYATKFELNVQAYVTQESEPNIEFGQKNIVTGATLHYSAASKPMSVVVATASNFWYCMCIIWCMVGYVFIGTLTGKYLVESLDKDSYQVPLSERGGYVSISIFFSFIVFGGIVVTIWSFYGDVITSGTAKANNQETPFSISKNQALNFAEVQKPRLVLPANTRYGCRPNFQVLFQKAAEDWEESNVGVLVCGPQSLQSSVAFQCRKQNCKNLWKRRVGFHYHSLSFDL